MEEQDVQVIAELPYDFKLNNTSANLLVLLLCRLTRSLRDLDVRRPGDDPGTGLEDLEEALENDVFKELGVPGLVLGQGGDGVACGTEEVLKVLFTAVEQAQTSFVSQVRLRTVTERSEPERLEKQSRPTSFVRPRLLCASCHTERQ
jgi:hypothetical protein